MTQNAPTAADFFAQQHDEDDQPEVTYQGQSLSPSPDAMWQITPDPLERVAASLEQLTAVMAAHTQLGTLVTLNAADRTGSAVEKAINGTAADAQRASAETGEEVQTLIEEIADLRADRGELVEVIDRIEAALGKSTAKPALAAKAVIDEWRNPQVPVEPELVQATEMGSEAWQAEYESEAEQVLEESPEQEAATLTVADPYAGAQVVPQEPASDAPVEEWREYARAQGLAGPHIDKANRSQIRTALGIAQPVTQ